ncbi:glycosyltransferase [Synechococcus sp. Tobar12-5m-g]|uniref:glycosyltransferase n=1 Tax=unclassified Synechococcus TaxID=2626047 RepID=UPI0020CC139C|nr:MULTISPECIES: glycosyltransferase [unclassified Synechococcus]MCP9772347.1 glycosyltransferase [Synechococcus sp. Tobar12-5m-g]MCP9873289.1 glycosyltransferase [Synechococcus sp. Cruz CV-v-12]
MASEALDLSLVIPLYRSEGSVDALVERLERLDPLCRWEVVFVDDGSPDDTVARLRRRLQGSSLRGQLIRHGRNFGEHQAVLTGYRHARGAYILNLDDDLQNPPEEGMRLWRSAIERGLDVVYGDYRDKRHAGWRNLGSAFANGTAHWLLDLPGQFYLSSFRCVSAEVAQQAALYRGPYPYIDGLLSQYTRAIGSLQVRHEVRRIGESGYNLRRLIRLWLNIFTSFSIMPLRLASLLGLVIAAAGLVSILVLVIQTMVYGIRVEGWLSIISTILLFGGLQSLLIGVMGEYLGRIFLTVSGKPQSFVRSLETIGASSAAGLPPEP